MVACQILVSKGADVNVRDNQLHTPLWCALQPMCKETSIPDLIVNYLLKSGATFEASDTDRGGVKILTHAIQHGHHTSAAMLLAKARACSAPEATAVSEAAWLAAAEHATSTSPLLKEFPADSSTAVVALRCAWQHQSTLDLQSGKGRKDLLTGTTFKDAPTKLQSNHASGLLRRMCKGMLSLLILPDSYSMASSIVPHSQCRAGLRWPTIQCFVGCHVRTTDGDGNTLLHHALVHSRLPEIAIILKAQVPLSTANSVGEQPLHTAARVHRSTPGIEAIISCLLGQGVHIDGPDKDGIPPLCHFAAAGNKPAVDALLARGATPSVTDNAGCTALHCLAAQSSSQLEALRIGAPSAPCGPPAVCSITSAKLRPLNKGGNTSRPSNPPRQQAESGSVSIFQQLKALIQVYSEIVDTLVVRTTVPVCTTIQCLPLSVFTCVVQTTHL
jgi:ankyrin repeat protein